MCIKSSLKRDELRNMKEIPAEYIDTILKNNLTRLIYFYTPLCGTCQVAGKMLTIIEELLPDVELGQANLNFYPRMATDLSIESVPCLLLFENGVLKEKIYAFHSVPFLYDKIKKLS